MSIVNYRESHYVTVLDMYVIFLHCKFDPFQLVLQNVSVSLPHRRVTAVSLIN